jgi:hypothetical protein
MNNKHTLPNQNTKDEVIFILSVDTEEEWDWSGPFPEKDFLVSNINEIPAFQLFCQEQGIKPTYLVDYAVADSQTGANVLGNLNKAQCEIGAHLHPWVNPPFYNETSEFSSPVINLPLEQVEEKLEILIERIKETLGCQPTSFRTGRWGINGDVLKLLNKHGISTDSSIYPLYHHQYFSCENAPTQAYWPNFEDTNKKGEQRDIFEIPVTCGFNRTNYALSQGLHKLMESAPFTWLRANSVLWHSKLLRKLYLSPELCSSSDMNRLIKTCLKRKEKVFHMYLHSSSLIDNTTGLNNEINARENICKRIQHVIENIQKTHRIKFCTLSEARALLVNENQQGSTL